MDQKINALSDKELEQITGGTGDPDILEIAEMVGCVMGRALNAANIAQAMNCSQFAQQCQDIASKGFALLGGSGDLQQIYEDIVALIPVGVFDSSLSEAYKELKLARKLLEDSGKVNVKA